MAIDRVRLNLMDGKGVAIAECFDEGAHQPRVSRRAVF